MALYSRSFEDDPNYNPNWRSLQAREYAKGYEQSQAVSPPAFFSIPEEEDDDLVIDYFTYLSLGTANRNSIKYAHSCNETNFTKGFGTMIQAMLLGGKSVKGIAEELFTTEENISTYLSLFFDVERYIECDLLMSSLVSPFDKNDDSFNRGRQTALWMGLSYAFGWDKAKNILQRKMDVDAGTVKIFTDAMSNCINMQAAEFSLAIRACGVSRPADFERYVAYTSATAITQGAQNENMASTAANFRNALFAVITENSKQLPEEHPLRVMIADREEDTIIEMEEKTLPSFKKTGIKEFSHL